jgi:hypothetical protein
LNPDATTNTDGWATYADAAGTTPVNGTGGSANVTFTRTTSALRGTHSFILTVDAANRQGQGCSYDFTVDNVDKNSGRTLIVSFDYSTGGLYASNDLRVFAYDVTNGTLMNVLNGDSGNIIVSATGSRFVGSFNPVITSSSYRLIIHCASTNASGYELYLDNVKVTPEQTVPGAIVTPWTAYTPTYSGLGAVVNSEMYWRRNMDQLEITGRFTTGTVAASEARISFPVEAAASAAFPNIRHADGRWEKAITGGSAAKNGPMLVEPSVAYFTFGFDDYTGTVSPFAKQNGNVALTTGTITSVSAKAPIANWQASAALSTTETMTMGAKSLAQVASFSVPHNSTTTITGWTEVYDTTGNLDPVTGIFTAGRTGMYLLNGGTYFAGAAGGGRYLDFYYNNTSVIAAYQIPDAAFAAPIGLNLNKVYRLNQGDTVRMRIYQNKTSVGALATDANAANTFFSVTELFDPTVFSVYGKFELKTATSSVKTPSATNNYHALTGNSIQLDPGTWELTGYGHFSNGGTTPNFTQIALGWFAANGGDSSSVPTLLSTVGTVLTSNPSSNIDVNNTSPNISSNIERTGKTVVRVTQPVTVYLVSYATMTTAANARITVYANAERKQ